jgi:hypothetical protein
MPDLGAIATALGDVGEGIACAGTALECRTFTVNGKTFLFVSGKEARLKLVESAGEAQRLGFAVGANGWVKLPLDGLPAANVVKRWIAESHAAIGKAPATKAKKAAGTKAKTVRRKTSRRRT